ncbi:MAG: hypothetical protein Q8P31_09345 [Bacillota bacterium]|nr:hypothetical protein [Bacillota bacterium]
MIQPVELKIARRTLLRRERMLPIPGELLVSKGQTVTPDTVVAKTEVLPGDPYVIDLKSEFHQTLTAKQVSEAMLKRVGDRVAAGEPIAEIARGMLRERHQVRSPVDGIVEFISRAYGRVLIREDPKSAMPVANVAVAKQLDIWPSSLRMYMRYREGDEVKQGAVLADSPSVSGMDYSYSPISGIIEKIDTRTGYVTIVRPARPTLVDAYLSGRIESTTAELGAVVTCTAAHIQGVFGVGFENYGYLKMVASDPGKIVDADDLTGELRDKVFVAGQKVTLEAVRKAAAGGARGFITGGMDHLDLVGFVGSEIGVGITGQEDVPLTIVLTEGFGGMRMADWTFDLLREHEGKLVSFNGSTQVRAGVIRPEVVIPLAGDDGPTSPEEIAPGGQLASGSRVRLLRKPYFGAWGTVIELPLEAQRIETEATLRVARVKLEDGGEVTVPEANIEVF